MRKQLWQAFISLLGGLQISGAGRIKITINLAEVVPTSNHFKNHASKLTGRRLYEIIALNTICPAKIISYRHINQITQCVTCLWCLKWKLILVNLQSAARDGNLAFPIIFPALFFFIIVSPALDFDSVFTSRLSDLGVFAPKTVVLDHQNTFAENQSRSYVICERRIF